MLLILKNLPNQGVAPEKPALISGSLESIGSVYTIVAAISALISFFSFGKFYATLTGSYGEFNFWAGLIAAVVVSGSLFLNGFLLKALSSIVQNTENTSNYLRYQIDNTEYNQLNGLGMSQNTTPANIQQNMIPSQEVVPLHPSNIGAKIEVPENQTAFPTEDLPVNDLQDLSAKIRSCPGLMAAEALILENSSLLSAGKMEKMIEKIERLKSSKRAFGLTDDSFALTDLSQFIEGNQA